MKNRPTFIEKYDRTPYYEQLQNHIVELNNYIDKLEKKIEMLNKQLDIASYDVAFFSEKPDDRISFYKTYRKQIRKNPDEQYKVLKEYLKKEKKEND